MKIKLWIFNLFHLNKQERNGVFVLCLIITLLILVKCFMPFMLRGNSGVEFLSIHIPSETKEIDTFKNGSLYKSKDHQVKEVNVSVDRFVFNPNTITEEDAQKLGFSKKLSTTLVNYRAKGGKFYKSEDLKKLYGMSPKLFDELEAYILIPNVKKEFKNDSATFLISHYSKPVLEKKRFDKPLIEINTADSLAIVYLRGIGPGFTKRIIKYRTMLGGFHSVNQLKEVYGMTDSLFLSLSVQIQLDKNAITKIPINAIDFNSLRKHPYFNFQTAQAVVNYRFKHGKLTEHDMINLGAFSEEKLKLILPYLSY